MRKNIIYFLLIFCGYFFYSCNPAKTLTESEYLVNKNKITIDDKNISTDDISSYIKQKPNRRIFSLFRFHLGVYNISHSKKEHKFLKWLGIYKMGNIIGEPPVILDTLLTNKSVKQIKLYLNSKGYFNATVKKEITYKKKKAKKINYIICSSSPYYLRNINFHIEDPVLKSIIIADTVNSYIHKGNIFDADVLQDERERITTKLKNDGYFFFSKEYISYEADSAFGEHKLDITLEVKNPVMKLKEFPDSVVPATHKMYLINNIYIYPNYSSLDLDTANHKKYPYWAMPRKKTSSQSLYTFVFKDTLKIKPKTITQSIFYKQGNYYKLRDVDDTYNSLMDLKIFKFVNIQFSETDDSSSIINKKLDCKILLTRTPIQSVSVETEATNSAGNLGVAGNLVYQNKNIFRAAEIFKFKIRGAMEVQKVLDEPSDETGIEQIIPNTVETGADAGLDIPKFFLMPVKQERFSKYFMPKTYINAGLNYQRRPDYTRYIVNFTYGWEFKNSKYQKIIFYPADVNSVKIYPTDEFLDKINSINDPKIKNSYIDHMIMAGRFSYIFNNQQIGKSLSFSYFKGNAEWSGNLLRLKNVIFNNYKTDNSYEVFNIKYSQYARTDIDYRHYFVFNEFNTLVFRVSTGAGIAYGNSKVLPFEKSFFSGGANGMRAWKIYTLGPGAYCDTSQTQLNHTGDINLLGNLEYRFPVYSFLKSALFIDAGNIWLNKKNDNMTDAEFTSSFYQQIAVGTGFGLRFDFSFFILRLDFGIRVVDPAKPEGQRWVFKYIKPSDFTINFGIGYPF
ncbi:MAG: BamA/TamA family outer membrane protein [Bacteroidota bacterium]